MITESFLNNCYYLIFNQNCNLKRNTSLYRDIFDILKQSTKSKEIPIVLADKINCLAKICELKINGKSDENIIDSISFSEKYKAILPFITYKQGEQLTEEQSLDIQNQLFLRKRFSSLVGDFDDISKFVDRFREGDFNVLDDLVLDYQDMVRRLYTASMEDSRMMQMQSSNSLVLDEDDLSGIVDNIKSKYTDQILTPTGFDIFDNEIFYGGLEPTRLYIFGGGSGSGKSTLLANIICRSALAKNGASQRPGAIFKRPGIKKVFIYITLENTNDETFLRMYQCINGKTLPDSVKDMINMGKDAIANNFKNAFVNNESTLVMKYFQSGSISASDISGIIDECIEKYGHDAIKGVFIDYLDLLRSDVKYDLYRIELGHITTSLKVLAVHYRIPVVTVTQLGRSAYRVQDARELNNDMMGESIKKVEHADFIALQARDTVREEIIHMAISKNRIGKRMFLDFNVDLSKFQFLNAIPINGPMQNNGGQPDYKSYKSPTGATFMNSDEANNTFASANNFCVHKSNF